MRNLLSLILLFAGSSSSLPAHEPARSDSSKEVAQVVDRLFSSMQAQDVEALRAIFIPEGRLISTMLRDGRPTTRVLSLDTFTQLVKETKEPYIERMFGTQIHVYGDLATVEGRYDFHVGARLTNCGTNAFQLVRTSEGWKIAHVASTIETQGCEHQSKE